MSPAFRYSSGYLPRFPWIAPYEGNALPMPPYGFGTCGDIAVRASSSVWRRVTVAGPALRKGRSAVYRAHRFCYN